MKRIVLLLASALAATPLMAQAPKIGVVDMERAIVQSIEGKKAEAAFTAKFEDLRKSIETRQKELETAQNKLKTQERVLAEDKKLELSKDIDRRQTELTRIQEDAQKDLDALRAELMRPIATIAETVLNKFAAEGNFALIVDTSNPQNTSVLFVNPQADVTDEIIKRIDAEITKTATPPKKP